MKKVKPKISKPKTLIKEERPAPPDRVAIFFAAGLILLLTATITLKIFKSDYAGITYDESMSSYYFGADVDKALNPTTISNKVVPITNNHVLNSIFMNIAGKLFPWYEHYIRIPSLAAGIIFSCALAYIVHRLICFRWLRLVLFTWISLVPFVFDYSYMARGYAFALLAIFGQFALVLWWLKHKIHFRFWLLPVLSISLLNFLAFGAMLSSLFYLAAFNMVFVLFFSWKIFDESPKPKWNSPILMTISFLLGALLITIVSLLIYEEIFPALYLILIILFFLHAKSIFPHPPKHKITSILLMGLSILLISSLSSLLLYRGTYEFLAGDVGFKDISSRWSGWPSFISLLYKILIDNVFAPRDLTGKIILAAVAAAALLSVGLHIFRFIKRGKQTTIRKYLQQDPSVTLFILTTLVSLTLLFVYSVIIKRSIGLDRNNLFLIPLVLLCLGIIIDRSINALKKKTPRYLTGIITTILLLAVLVHYPPSTHYISPASISGPLLRQLKAIDPDRTWDLGFSQQARLFPMAFSYYRYLDLGYKFTTPGEVANPNYEIRICRLPERRPEYYCLDYDNFIRVGCIVEINPNLFPNQQALIEAQLLTKQ
ncbi:MAG: hypothetical protein GY869_21465 [Planctomycetes bacterium]|nr:hypothetical protein [Planctomycetota bacterium]